MNKFLFFLTLGIGATACGIDTKDALVSVGDDTVDDDGDGVSEEGGDCNDGNSAIHPGAPERCDGVDNDCDGEVDENTEHIWHDDKDGDGYGDDGSSDKDSGTIGEESADLGDASDTDTGVVGPVLPEDTDGSTPITCEGGGEEGDVDNAEDCDDKVATTYPGAPEVCDDVDNSCDGNIDEDAVDAPIWYTDADDDGYGDASGSYAACDPKTGGDRSNGLDCDDANAAINPDALEICDELDNDCNGEVDDNPSGPAAAVETCWDRAGYECFEVNRCLVVSGEAEECLTEAECLREVRDEGIGTLETRW